MHYSKDGQYIAVAKIASTSSQELDQKTLKQIEELEKENKTLLSKIDQLGEISLSEGPYLAYSAAGTMNFYEEAVPYESQMIMQDGPIAGVASGNLIIKPQTRYGVVCKPEVGYIVQSRYGVVWPRENYEIGIKGKLKNTPDGFYVTDEKMLQQVKAKNGDILKVKSIVPTGNKNDIVEMESYLEPLSKNGVAEVSSEIKPLIQANAVAKDKVKIESYVQPVSKNGVAEVSSEIKPLIQTNVAINDKATMESYVTPLNKSENAKVISEMRKITPTNDVVEMKSYIEPLNKNGVAEASSEIKPLIQNEVWREIKPIK